MMLSESDLYNSNTEPNNNVNPKSLGAMWINYSNGRHYICSNNTMNNNTWLDPIGILTNEFNSNINNLTNDTNNRINTINSNIEKLTTDTDRKINGNRNDIIANNSKINGINTSIGNIINKINELNDVIGNIHPDPIVFTTYTTNYNFHNGPYKKDVWYTNTDNKPMCIILSTNTQHISSPSISMRIHNLYMVSGNASGVEQGNCITGIIPPGARFSMSTSGTVFSAEYMIIE